MGTGNMEYQTGKGKNTGITGGPINGGAPSGYGVGGMTPGIGAGPGAAGGGGGPVPQGNYQPPSQPVGNGSGGPVGGNTGGNPSTGAPGAGAPYDPMGYNAQNGMTVQNGAYMAQAGAGGTPSGGGTSGIVSTEQMMRDRAARLGRGGSPPGGPSYQPQPRPQGYGIRRPWADPGPPQPADAPPEQAAVNRQKPGVGY